MAKKKRPSGVRNLSTREKIARLEKQLEELEIELPDASPRRAGVIERQIRIGREQLRKLKIHTVSKIESIRCHTVPGSYGTGRRTN